MYEFLFLDLDDTILDFRKAERVAVSGTFASLGIEPTEAVLERYHVLNDQHWKLLERGKLTREQVVIRRFGALFAELGVDADPAECAGRYEKNLSVCHYFLPGAEEAVAQLSQRYRLFLASNGTASVQAGRLTGANLYRFFEKTFISQEIGANKPSPEFFRRSAARIPGFDPSRAMMVGDSLTSDILGGINAGFRTCWINPTHKTAPDDIQPDYEIEALHQLPAMLEALENI